MARTLTAKQFKFIEAYNGNGTEASKIAGYKGEDDNVHAQNARDLLSNPQIAQLIKERQKPDIEKIISTREERQAFWKETMADKKIDLKHRLRASELLGKSNADFIETVNLNHKGASTILFVEADESSNDK